MTAFLVDTVRIWLALVLLVSITGKLRAWADLVEWVESLRLVPHRAAGPAAVGLVAAETAALVLLAIPASADIGLLLTAVTMTGFAIVIARLHRRGVRVACRCLGVTTRPMGYAEVVRNLILAAAGCAAAARPPATGSAWVAAQAAVVGVALAAVTVRWTDLAGLLAPPARTRI
jgi:hypothetical protein